jgi:hypothetical protein
MPQSEVKNTLKEKVDILGTKDSLLGAEFRDKIMKDKEARNKMDGFRRKKYTKNSHQPFRQGPSQRNGGGHHPNQQRFVYRKRQEGAPFKGQFDKERPFSQHSGVSGSSTKYRFKKCSPSSNKFVPGVRNSPVPLAGR